MIKARVILHKLSQLMLSLLFATVPLVHAQTFISAPRYNPGDSPNAAYAGDFNGDGKADLAVTTFSGISILLANADGTFQHYHSFSAAVGSLTVGDFNGDGKLDLAGSGSGVVTIFAGQGNGTFQTLGSVTANSPASLAAADMNGDGKLDVIFAISSRQTQGVGVLLGNGDGTFQPEIDTIFDRGALDIKIGDFNSDGKLDVVAVVPLSYAKTNLRVLLGKGDGTFQTPIDSLVTDYASTVSVADFDNDGHLDVAVQGGLTNAAFVLFGSGDGHLRNSHSFPVGLGPRAVVAADFDGDGKADIAVVNYTDNTVSLLLGTGTGAFLKRVDYGAGESPFALSAGDFNGDGRPDLVVPNSVACCESPAISVLLNNGNGTLYASRFYDTGVTAASTVATGDLNGDGFPDIVVGTRTDTVTVLIANGDGTFGKPHLYGTSAQSTAVAVADFNHDGKLDVIATSEVSGGSHVSVLLGNGDGTLQPYIDTPVPHSPFSIAVGDLNRDGNPDVVVGEADTYPAPGDLAILMGNGDGTFQPAQTYNTGGVGSYPSPVITDVNADGKLDVLAANGSMLGVLLGRGDGTFRPRIDSTAGTQLFSLATGDLDRDGNLDVVAAGSGGGAGGSAGIMFGNGDGTFRPIVKYTSARGPSSPSVADFNQDGWPDVAVTNQYGTVSTFLNNGDGTLQRHADYAVGDYSEQNAAADFNGDGYPDLVVANTGAGFAHNVTVLLNQGANQLCGSCTK